MTAVLVSYATGEYRGYQRLLSLSARHFGVDGTIESGPQDLDSDFATAHAGILSIERGAGCWLWKPWVVRRALDGLDEGDVLIYCDAAVHFVRPVEPLVDRLESLPSDLLILGEGFTEAAYTKRDAFRLLDCDRPEIVDSKQRFASCFAFRKSSWSVDFVERYLQAACDPRILTDQPNECGLPNYPGFIAHRHDQSIFSLLTKIEGIDCPVTGYLSETLSTGPILHHTRMHEPPGAVAARLLALGAITLGDVESLTASDRGPSVDRLPVPDPAPSPDPERPS